MTGVDRSCRFAARRLAAAARFSANAAMLVHSGMTFALFGANAASLLACLDGGGDDAFVGAGAA